MRKPEPTRVRKQGTRVTLTKTGKEIVEACRSIIKNGQYEKINGVMVDLFSASAIVKIYDALSDANKAKFETLPLGKMADISFKMLK